MSSTSPRNSRGPSPASSFGWTSRRCRRIAENHAKDGDLPLVWAKTYGKGRIFYSSFGHEAGVWDNRDIAQMYFEAIKWALGLTEGDATPRPFKPNP